MKTIIKSNLIFTHNDFAQSLNKGWNKGLYGQRQCLENDKVIFVPKRVLDRNYHIKIKSRGICKYCNTEHLDYACDKQIEFIKKQFNLKTE